MTKLGTSFAILEYLIKALLRLENAKKSVKITQNVSAYHKAILNVDGRILLHIFLG